MLCLHRAGQHETCAEIAFRTPSHRRQASAHQSLGRPGSCIGICPCMACARRSLATLHARCASTLRTEDSRSQTRAPRACTRACSRPEAARLPMMQLYTHWFTPAGAGRGALCLRSAPGLAWWGAWRRSMKWGATEAPAWCTALHCVYIVRGKSVCIAGRSSLCTALAFAPRQQLCLGRACRAASCRLRVCSSCCSGFLC